MSTLYLVPTPVGNLEDITLRALRILKEVQYILAEDTRVTGILLKHYEISTPLKSYHDHNEEHVASRYISLLKNGDSLALVTDAGSPGIADPAFFIVRACLREGIRVVPLPGATAFVPAITASGLSCERFIFENFLAPKSSKRKAFFASMATEKRTVIFYESPHRILKVLGEFNEVLPDVELVIGREISKLFEEFLRGTAQEILEHYRERTPKGEMVVMFNAHHKLVTRTPQGLEESDDE